MRCHLGQALILCQPWVTSFLISSRRIETEASVYDMSYLHLVPEEIPTRKEEMDLCRPLGNCTSPLGYLFLPNCLFDVSSRRDVLEKQSEESAQCEQRVKQVKFEGLVNWKACRALGTRRWLAIQSQSHS